MYPYRGGRIFLSVIHRAGSYSTEAILSIDLIFHLIYRMKLINIKIMGSEYWMDYAF